ncbi:MAG: hypothetical protein Q9195_001807, partial [Heterodermia aff. obscurata]
MQSRLFKSENLHILSAVSIQKSLESQLVACPSDSYVLVSQPGASTEGYTNANPVPHMRAKLSGSDEKIRSRVIVDAVHGDIDLHSMSKLLQEKCGAVPMKIDAS